MICIPIKAKKLENALNLIKKAEEKADIIEIWLDSIKDLDLKKLFENKKKPYLIVNKTPDEKGSFTEDENKRIAILIEAAGLGADYIDVSVDTTPALIKKLCENKGGAKIIISYHNFKKTPKFEEMQKIVDLEYEFGADIGKITAYAETYEDNLEIFKLLKIEKEQDRKIIAHLMGDKGKISRIFNSFLGSYLTFASLNEKEKTADGQMTIEELKKINEILCP
jgi:3-dehydroquinate dehydratase type I